MDKSVTRLLAYQGRMKRKEIEDALYRIFVKDAHAVQDTKDGEPGREAVTDFAWESRIRSCIEDGLGMMDAGASPEETASSIASGIGRLLSEYGMRAARGKAGMRDMEFSMAQALSGFMNGAMAAAKKAEPCRNGDVRMRGVPGYPGLRYRTAREVLKTMDGTGLPPEDAVRERCIRASAPEGYAERLLDADYDSGLCLEILTRYPELSGFIPESAYSDAALMEEAGVTALPDGFAEGDGTLMAFMVPGCITRIGRRAFADCGNLIDIRYGGTISIGREAFLNCRSLMTRKLPSGIRHIGRDAFAGCPMLSELEIFGEDGTVTLVENDRSGTDEGGAA